MPLAIAKSAAPRDALGTMQEARRERAAEADDSRGDKARAAAAARGGRCPAGATRRPHGAARSMEAAEEGRQRRRVEPDEHLDRPAAGGEQRRLAEAARGRRAVGAARHLPRRAQRQRDERRLLPRRRRVLHRPGRAGAGPAGSCRTWPRWTCRTGRCCACSPTGCSRPARWRMPCRCSSGCSSWRRTSRNRTATSAWRWPRPARRRRPSTGSMKWSPAAGTDASPTST